MGWAPYCCAPAEVPTPTSYNCVPAESALMPNRKPQSQSSKAMQKRYKCMTADLMTEKLTVSDVLNQLRGQFVFMSMDCKASCMLVQKVIELAAELAKPQDLAWEGLAWERCRCSNFTEWEPRASNDHRETKHLELKLHC